MHMKHTRHIPVVGTFNIRDLGGYTGLDGETQWRRMFRADGLHRLDAAGMALLVDEGVTTVIDLRHDRELVSQPDPFYVNPTVAYHNVSLFEALIPEPGEKGDVLYDLYIKALNHRPVEIVRVLTLIAEAPQGIVLFHCTAGKDRTGIIAALLLALAGVSADLIVEDYALTGPMIAPMIDDILAHAALQGTDLESFRPLLAAEPRTMADTISYIDRHYGSATDYLAKSGLRPDTAELLRHRLMYGDL
ncbi:tyrosine-protein phosphatase [Ochrobactrum sp. RH2CCR150]|uniref:tyrosine-protein phosphatase n=1 Tax=Ochrobactrum sp. RH2CCR150 TaxID=2587044 RepID=UPI0015FD3D3E|nr:protein-tyrosine phosphatase [Ochrobactrum sp. RH2CCR150]